MKGGRVGCGRSPARWQWSGCRPDGWLLAVPQDQVGKRGRTIAAAAFRLLPEALAEGAGAPRGHSARSAPSFLNSPVAEHSSFSWPPRLCVGGAGAWVGLGQACPGGCSSGGKPLLRDVGHVRPTAFVEQSPLPKDNMSTNGTTHLVQGHVHLHGGLATRRVALLQTGAAAGVGRHKGGGIAGREGGATTAAVLSLALAPTCASRSPTPVTPSACCHEGHASLPCPLSPSPCSPSPPHIWGPGTCLDADNLAANNQWLVRGRGLLVGDLGRAGARWYRRGSGGRRALLTTPPCPRQRHSPPLPYQHFVSQRQWWLWEAALVHEGH